jgi:hypothetical protein
MKKSIRLIVAIGAILLLLYIASTDAAIRWFHASQSVQYAVNLAVLCLMPGLISLTGYPEWANGEEKRDSL